MAPSVRVLLIDKGWSFLPLLAALETAHGTLQPRDQQSFWHYLKIAKSTVEMLVMGLLSFDRTRLALDETQNFEL
jgi:hypothetical protein